MRGFWEVWGWCMHVFPALWDRSGWLPLACAEINVQVGERKGEEQNVQNDPKNMKGGRKMSVGGRAKGLVCSLVQLEQKRAGPSH